MVSVLAGLRDVEIEFEKADSRLMRRDLTCLTLSHPPLPGGQDEGNTKKNLQSILESRWHSESAAKRLWAVHLCRETNIRYNAEIKPTS
jgi:hypothetical protein